MNTLTCLLILKKITEMRKKKPKTHKGSYSSGKTRNQDDDTAIAFLIRPITNKPIIKKDKL